MSGWPRRGPWRRGAGPDELHAADEEFARARDQLTGAGFAADAQPDPGVEQRVLRRSAAAVERLRDAERRAGRGGAAVPRARPPRRLFVTGLAAAAVAGVVTIGVVAPWGAPPAAAATPPLLVFSQVSATSDLEDAPSAHSRLGDLADRAEAQPPSTPPSTDGYTVTSAQWSLGTSLDADEPLAAVVPFQTVVEVSRDGAMERVEQRGEPLTPDGRGAAAGVGRLLGPQVQADSFPPGFVDTGLVQRLPRDPEALRAELLERRGCPSQAPGPDAEPGSYGATCVLSAVVDLYRDQLVPPDLAAALWRVLAEEPALHDAGTGVDRAGRPCLAVALEVGGGGGDARTERWLLLADPVTGAYLGEERVLVEGSVDGLQAPVVLEFATLVSAA